MTDATSSIFQSPEIRIVEASAGSGKTFALAKRYVQLLLMLSAGDNRAMRYILAITFTNKASFEMKARILEFLKKAAFEQLSPSEYDQIIRPLGWNSREAALKASGAMEDILAHYNDFQIQTIDKFINAILSASAFRMGLTAQFRIRTRPEDYLQLSLDRLIDRARRHPDVTRLFDEFLEHYLYLENRTGWFPKKDILLILRTLFDLHNTYGINLGYDALSSRDVIRRKSSLLKELGRLRDELPDGVHQRFRGSLESFLEKHPRGFDLDDLPDGFAREELPLKKDAQVSRSVENLWTDIRRDLKSLCEEEAMGVFSPYVEIFEKIDEDFQETCSRADIVFLAELNRKAAQLFGERAVSLEEIYARLASRFRHYLMDEFQDTSRLQWSNIRPMVEEALSSGGTLFYVGDRKQAIYSFRGGDSQLFDDAQDHLSVYPCVREKLTSNWRSFQEIITFNNDIFSPENLEKFLRTKEAEQKNAVVFDDQDTGYLLSVFDAARQTSGHGRSGGCVRVSLIDGANKLQRDELTRRQLIPLVRDVLKRFSPSEVAILSRNNQEVESVTRWLMEEGFSVRSDRTSDIRRNPLIRELVAFLKFLNSPIDNAAFADFVTGEMFARASGVASEQWHRFVFDCHRRARGCFPNGSQQDCHSREGGNPVSFEKKTLDPGVRRDDRSSENHLPSSYLYLELRRAHPEVWSRLIEPFFKNVGLYPLYELTVSIYHAFGCLACFPDDQGFLMRFLEIIKNQEDECGDLAAFLAYYENADGEDVYVTSIDENAVIVTTIHKSKGLEFGAVILPSLVMDIHAGAGGENHLSFVPWQKDGRLHLLRLKSQYYKFSEQLKGIYEFEYKKALLSELNGVYVALTRGREEMHVMVPSKVGSSFNPVRWLIPESCYERGKIPGRHPQKISAGASVKLSPACDQDWVRFLHEEFADDQHQRHLQKKRGEILHRLLACVGDLSSQKMEDLRALWETALMASDVAPEEHDAYLSGVEKIISDQDLARFFYLSGGSSGFFNEFEMVNAFGDVRRMDRVILKDGEVWIVDYKFGRDRMQKDRRQVEDYKTLMADIHRDRTIRGFLVYVGEMINVIEL